MQGLQNNSVDALKQYTIKTWLANYLPQPVSTLRRDDIPNKHNSKSVSLSLQNNYKDMLCRIGIYVLQGVQVLMMLVIMTCSIKPILRIGRQDIVNRNAVQEVQQKINTFCVIFILVTRIVLALAYIIILKIRNNYMYAFNKITQIICLLLFGVPISSSIYLLLCFALMIQYLADSVHIYCKQQRLGYFDSRISYGNYIVRRFFSFLIILHFNSFQVHGLAALLTMLACVAVNWYCILFDSIYSLLTSNLLLIYWTSILFKISYFALLLLVKNVDSFKQLNNAIITNCIILLIILFILIFSWKNRSWVSTLAFKNFAILQVKFHTLQSRNAQLQYLWQAIRFLSIEPQNYNLIKDTVHNINWTLNQVQQSLIASNILRKTKISRNKRELYLQFYSRFQQYCYRIMLQKFKGNQQIKYMFIFCYHERSAQKILLYLNKSNFFDIRERQRIHREHKNSDLAAKIHEMQINQVQIYKTVKQYIRKLKSLVSLILENNSGIDLSLCNTYGEQLMKIQSIILLFGFQEMAIQEIQQDDNKKAIDNEPIPAIKLQLLSNQSRILLNIVRKQMFGMEQLPSPNIMLSKDEKTITEIMNQQQSLIFISAQLDSLGEIVAINQSASKLTCYTEQEIVGKNLKLILPEGIHVAHSKILAEKTVSHKKSQVEYVHKNVVYVVKKSKYCSLCLLSVRFIDGTMGKRWIAKLKEVENMNSYIICDSLNNIIGFNEKSLSLGIGFDWLNVNLSQNFANQLKKLQINDLDLGSVEYDKRAKQTVIFKLGQLKRSSNYQQIRKKREQLIMIAQKKHSGESNHQLTSMKVIQQPLRTNSYGQYEIYDELQVECCIVNKTLMLAHIQILGFYVLKLSQHIIAGKKQLDNLINNSSITLQPEKKLKNVKLPFNTNKMRQSFRFAQKQESSEGLSKPQFQFNYSSFQNKLRNFRNVQQKQLQWDNSEQQQIKLDYIKNIKSPKISSRFHSRQQSNVVKPVQSANNMHEHDEVVDSQQINELIYINGELQFRQNKKLQQKHQCDTHPLHINHHSFHDLTEQQQRIMQISNKNQVYKLLKINKTKSPTQYKNLNKINIQFNNYYTEQKVLFCLFVIFLIIGLAFAITGIIICKNIIRKQTDKINIEFIMSERVALLNDLANNFNGVIIKNLDLIIQKQKINREWDIGEVIGKSTYWFEVIKQIASKSSDINSIDTIQNLWKHSFFTDQIPSLHSKTDFTEQYDTLFVNLLKLQDIYNKHPQIIQVKNSTILNLSSELSSEALKLYRKLLQEIIPMNIYTISKTKQIYDQTINSISLLLKIISLIFGALSITFAFIVFYHIRKIQLMKRKNLQLISFFPCQYLQDLYNKLDKIQSKFNDDQDITSQIGLQELNYQAPVYDQLLFHKKKLKKNGSNFNLLILFSFLIYLVLGFGTIAVILLGFNQAINTYLLQDWFFIVNGQITQLNYIWHKEVLQEGIDRVPLIQDYFYNKPFLLVPIEQILKNRDYVNKVKINYNKIYNGILSKSFDYEVSNSLGTGYCQIDQDLPNLPICQNLISDFSVQSIDGYIDLKKFSIKNLFYSALQSKHTLQFLSILRFFDNSTAKYNQKNLFKKNKEIIQNQMIRIDGSCSLHLVIGLIIMLLIGILSAIVYFWFVNKSVQYINKPILIMTRCFPLLALNHNQSFLNWYNSKRNKDLR